MPRRRGRTWLAGAGLQRLAWFGFSATPAGFLVSAFGATGGLTVAAAILLITFYDYVPRLKPVPLAMPTRDAGKFRLEGKDYVVADGDVLHFRFAL